MLLFAELMQKKHKQVNPTLGENDCLDYFADKDQPEQLTVKTVSGFKQSYLRDLPEVQTSQKLMCEEMILKSGFAKRQTFQNIVSCVVLNSNLYSKTLKLAYGYYETQVNVLYMPVDFQFIFLQLFSKGSFGQIYCFQNKKQNFAIKRVQMSSEIDSRLWKQFLREVFMNKFASALEVGPCFSKIYGYDIVVWPKFAEFVTQLCMEKQQFQKNSVIKELQKALSILHSFAFLHCDIKTDNTAWSPTFRKQIFLDFGFSRFISQKAGELTKTRFCGTFGFVTNQMMKTYFLEKPCFVDLYYNDLFGLRQLPKVNKKGCYLNQPSITEQSQDTEWATYCVPYFSFSFHLFKKQFVICQEILRNNRILQGLFSQIVNLVKEQSQTFINLTSFVSSFETKLIHKKGVVYQMELSLRGVSTEFSSFEFFSLQKLMDKLDETKIIDFKQCLKRESWVDGIFWFLFEISFKNAQLNKKKLKLANQLNKYLTKNYQQDKYREDIFILIEILEFFCEKYYKDKNIKKLRKISSNFLIILDFYNKRQTDKMILEICSQSQEDYFCYILQLFFIAYKNEKIFAYSCQQIIDMAQSYTERKTTQNSGVKRKCLNFMKRAYENTRSYKMEGLEFNYNQMDQKNLPSIWNHLYCPFVRVDQKIQPKFNHQLTVFFYLAKKKPFFLTRLEITKLEQKGFFHPFLNNFENYWNIQLPQNHIFYAKTNQCQRTTKFHTQTNITKKKRKYFLKYVQLFQRCPSFQFYYLKNIESLKYDINSAANHQQQDLKQFKMKFEGSLQCILNKMTQEHFHKYEKAFNCYTMQCMLDLLSFLVFSYKFVSQQLLRSFLQKGRILLELNCTHLLYPIYILILEWLDQVSQTNQLNQKIDQTDNMVDRFKRLLVGKSQTEKRQMFYQFYKFSTLMDKKSSSKQYLSLLSEYITKELKESKRALFITGYQLTYVAQLSFLLFRDYDLQFFFIISLELTRGKPYLQRDSVEMEIFYFHFLGFYLQNSEYSFKEVSDVFIRLVTFKDVVETNIAYFIFSLFLKSIQKLEASSQRRWLVLTCRGIQNLSNLHKFALKPYMCLKLLQLKTISSFRRKRILLKTYESLIYRKYSPEESDSRINKISISFHQITMKKLFKRKKEWSLLYLKQLFMNKINKKKIIYSLDIPNSSTTSKLQV